VDRRQRDFAGYFAVMGLCFPSSLSENSRPPTDTHLWSAGPSHILIPPSVFRRTLLAMFRDVSPGSLRAMQLERIRQSVLSSSSCVVSSKCICSQKEHVSTVDINQWINLRLELIIPSGRLSHRSLPHKLNPFQPAHNNMLLRLYSGEYGRGGL